VFSSFPSNQGTLVTHFSLSILLSQRNPLFLSTLHLLTLPLLKPFLLHIFISFAKVKNRSAPPFFSFSRVFFFYSVFLCLDLLSLPSVVLLDVSKIDSDLCFLLIFAVFSFSFLFLVLFVRFSASFRSYLFVSFIRILFWFGI